MRAIRVGGPIVLAVIGLILALAVSDAIPGVDLTMVGWILFGAALVWLAIEVIMNRPRTRVTEVHESRGGGDAMRREEQRDI
ncbi:DUF6458 family protein [Granulicoccus sp. GXG6511]|uniref:DUF6458 family protein n=1 Tax=Granulicoccus sp. GXG6511 TaxID=3381351 RepID=UPI003D7CE4CD